MIRAANRPKSGAVPYVVAEAQFVAHYGADMLKYRGDLTTDGVIPFRAFVLFLAALPNVLALQAANQVRAISIALAGAFGDKTASRRLRELVKESGVG
jgi:predicted TIM-barrel enzyme